MISGLELCSNRATRCLKLLREFPSEHVCVSAQAADGSGDIPVVAGGDSLHFCDAPIDGFDGVKKRLESRDAQGKLTAEPIREVALAFFEVEESCEVKTDVSPAFENVRDPMAIGAKRLKVVQAFAADTVIREMVKVLARSTARALKRAARCAISIPDALPSRRVQIRAVALKAKG